MAQQDIIVIGASAGGIEACRELLQTLPDDLPASIFIVVHISATAPSVLPRILGRGTKLTVKNPDDGEVPKKGCVYVAPANHHMILKPDLIRLGRGARENGCRPSVDSLFRTAAFAYGPRVVGIILSGALNDGTAGLMSIKSNGGIAMVQSPDEAGFAGMPTSAIEFVDVDFVLPVSGIAGELVRIVQARYRESNGSPASDHMARIYESGTEGLRQGMEGQPSNLTCPACGGALWESDVESFKEFKCHVGHSFTAESLLQEQSDAIDTTFWRTLRQLEENIALRKKLIGWAQSKKSHSEVLIQQEQLQLAERQADSIRQALLTDVPKLGDESAKN